MKPGLGVVPRIMICAVVVFAGGCGQPGTGEPASPAVRQVPQEDKRGESSAPVDLAASVPQAGRVETKPESELTPVAVATEPVSVIAGVNLLKNGSFDQAADPGGEIAHWRVPEHVAAELDAESYDGPWALRIDLTGNENLGAPQMLSDVTAGAYLIRGYLRAEELEGGARLEVQDAAGGYKSFFAFTDSVEGTHDWTQVAKVFTVPNHVKSLAVFLRHPGVEDAADAVGAVWFDRCELFRLAPSAGADLVRNGSFEWGDNGLSWWGNVPDGVVATQGDDAVDGEKSLQVTLAHGQNLGIAQGMGVIRGKRYVVTGYVKCDNVTGMARLEVVDVNDGWKSFMACSDAISGTQNWTPLTLVFEAPDHLQGVNLLLRCVAEERAAEGTGTVSFDRYAMYELAD
jgi:hypothetical protein